MAPELSSLHSNVPENGSDTVVALTRQRIVEPHPPHRPRARLREKTRDRIGGQAAAKDQPASQRLQAGSERRGGHADPHAWCRPDPVYTLVAKKDRYYRPSAFSGRVESGVIRQAQVATEPEKDRLCI
jgi:hypothetical protein